MSIRSPRVAGKGDTQRPAAVPPDIIEDNWRRTFLDKLDKMADLKARSSDMSPAMPAGVETTTPSTPTGTPTASAVVPIREEKEFSQYVPRCVP